MTTAYSIPSLRSAFQGTLPLSEEQAEGRVAAVAAVLRQGTDGVELLFIRRAKRRGDPWSGHMAWPGGKREAGDAGLVACAVRETREEVGLDLDVHGQLLGSLRPLRWESSRPAALRAVFGFVFVVDAAARLSPGAEVQEAVWIPLAYFDHWLSRAPWSWIERWLPPVPPAYRYHGRLIWGLTLWMLADLLRRGRACNPGGKASPSPSA